MLLPRRCAGGFPSGNFFCLFLCFEWLTHPHMIHRKSGMSSCSISIRVSGFFLLLFCACFVPEMLYMPRLSHERMCNIRERREARRDSRHEHDRMACERRAARSDASHEQTEGLRKCVLALLLGLFFIYSFVWSPIFQIFENSGHFRTARSGVYIVED